MTHLVLSATAQLLGDQGGTSLFGRFDFILLDTTFSVLDLWYVGCHQRNVGKPENVEKYKSIAILLKNSQTKAY